MNIPIPLRLATPRHEQDASENASIANALTIDVEDYFHVSAFEKCISRDQWECYPPRVEYNTHRLLDILDEAKVKATFFVLGWVAERHQELVKELARRGHEVGSHGYYHKLVYNQSPAEFKEETRASKGLLEDLIGDRVLGYRAASFSITAKSLWALEILKDLGFAYDTSIFPVRHDRYGIPNAPRVPHQIVFPDGKTLTEFPMTTVLMGRTRLPGTGGGYFRLLPFMWTRMCFSRTNRLTRMPVMFYIHPWELDPAQPKIHSASLLSRLRHYTNLQICEKRLRRLLRELKFESAIDVMASITGMPIIPYSAYL